MPSVWRNLFLALLLLGLSGGAVYSYVTRIGDPTDAVANGQVGLTPLPLPEVSDSLNGDTENLPDLLQGIVPENVNPTETLNDSAVDALGNPIRNDNRSDDNEVDEILGPDILSQLEANQPSQVLIEGRPLDGSALYPASPLPNKISDDLSRPSPFGHLPKKALDGRTVAKAYARPFKPKPGFSQIAIVVGGLGVNEALTKQAIYNLPPEVTLSFAAHTPNLQSWINKARTQGHEVMIEVPMESDSSSQNDPWADKLLSSSVSHGRNIRNLDWIMSRAQGYFALTNYNGDRLLKRSDVMAPIMAHMADAGVGFVFDGSVESPSLPTLAASANVPMISAHSLIDTQPTISGTSIALQNLELAAESQTLPMGFGFAYLSTIEALQDWVGTLPDKKVELAPASYNLNK